MPTAYSPNLRRSGRNVASQETSQVSQSSKQSKKSDKKLNESQVNNMKNSRANNIYEILEEDEENNLLNDRNTVEKNNSYKNSNDSICHDLDGKEPSLRDIMIQVKENHNSLQYMSNVFDENKKILEELSILKNNFDVMRKELNYVRNELNQLKQEKLKNNLIVYGLKKDDNIVETKVELKEKFCSALNKVKINISNEDINSCYRMHDKNKNSPVIIELVNEEKKIYVMKNKKALRTNNPKDFVSVYEHLTSFSYKLLLEVRSKLSGLFKYIWTRNGRILIKKNDDASKPNIVYDYDDISYYQNN